MRGLVQNTYLFYIPPVDGVAAVKRPLPRRERDVAQLEDGNLQREVAEVRDEASDQPAVRAVLRVAVSI